jgi:hypothetical protein
VKLTPSYVQFAKIDASVPGAKWLTVCTEHAAMTEAPSRKAGRDLGSSSARVAWCKRCAEAAAEKSAAPVRKATRKATVKADAAEAAADAAVAAAEAAVESTDAAAEAATA